MATLIPTWHSAKKSRGDMRENGRVRAPDTPRSNKEMRKWAKVVSIGFFGTLEMNKRLALHTSVY